MEITAKIIDELAHLARLQFSETEKKSIQIDLQRMVAFVEKLKEVDTEGVEPLLYMGDTLNVLREDEVLGSVTRSEALRNAPLPDDAFFKVPTVIKK